MGIKDYFRTKPPAAPVETLAASHELTDALELRPPFMPGSGTGSTSGVGSSRSSAFMIDDIKHEVMVNYLYQQQSSHLWVNPNPLPGQNSGDEGVLLRKSKGYYMACPPALGNSLFAEACIALNVHVRLHPNPRNLVLVNANANCLLLGCYDRQFSRDQDVPAMVTGCR